MITECLEYMQQVYTQCVNKMKKEVKGDVYTMNGSLAQAEPWTLPVRTCTCMTVLCHMNRASDMLVRLESSESSKLSLS